MMSKWCSKRQKKPGLKLDQKEFMEALNELNLSDSDLNSLILWCQKNKISINGSDSDDDEDIEELDSDDDSLDDGEDEDSEDSGSQQPRGRTRPSGTYFCGYKQLRKPATR